MTQEQQASPKVSIVVPVYNMERYLEQCLDAICGQTLEDIEIIAVNDGSTDSSLDILRRYADADERIRIIDKPNSGYGASMNRGIAEARGEYIGIVEPDDYPDLAMFEKLWHAAEKHCCDLVKCNYYEHYEDHESIQRVFAGFEYGAPFDPADRPEIICTIPAIWAGLYRRSMLESAHVRFRETPGASFQDTGFTLKAWFAARSVILVRRPLLHYRMDNPGSSVKTEDKVMAVCDELAEAELFLRSMPVRRGAFAPWLQVSKWGKYRWNYARIDASMRPVFAQRMYDEFAGAQADGELVMGLFGSNGRAQVAQLLTEGPEAFIERYGDRIPEDWEVDPLAVDLSEAAQALADDSVPTGSSPAITVMIAAYNCEQYIEECLASLKAQTFSDFEAIVVDDASSDRTTDRARGFMCDDERFTLIECEKNGGPGAARNIALNKARGEYVMYLDSDDRLAVGALERIVGKMRRQNLDELYFSAQSFYDDAAATKVMHEDFSGRTPYEGVATGRELFTFFSDRAQYFSQGALRAARRDLIEFAGVRFPEGIIHEDVLYCFGILTASKRSSFLNEPLYLRRQRVGSIMDSSRRSVENVRGHVKSILEIRRWVCEHAESLDDAFTRAVAREVGLWSMLAAHDWTHEMTEADRKVFLETVPAEDRLALQFDILGMGEASERAAAEWRESATYRLGDAIATVPRFARTQLGAVLNRRKVERM